MSRSKPNSQSPSSFATDPFLSQLPLLNLTIEKLVIGGAGLARIQSGSFQNMVIFIPFACPGDHVEVRITKKHKNHLEGRIERILVPGPSRRTPPCPHATDCGGCNWQHLTTDEQIKQKHQLISDSFQKFAPSLQVPEFTVLPSPQALNYRNRIQPKFQRSQKSQNNESAMLGFFKHQSHELVNIDKCLIIETPLQEKWSELRQFCMSQFQDMNLHRIEMNLDAQNAVHYRELLGEQDLGQFAQVNSLQNEQMLRMASEWVADFRGSFYLDLYAGSGNFTLKLAKHFKDQGHAIKTHAVEYSQTLVKRLRNTLHEGEPLNISVTEGDVELYLRKAKIPQDSLIVLDPPRVGASRQTLELIAQIMPQRLIYVSCHPVSLARDLEILAEFHARANSTRTQKKLKLRKVQGFEMFPQTDHVETMIELSFD